MPYLGNPQNIGSDAVRVLVGDISTSTGGEWMANAEYNYFLSVASNHYVAAQLAANSLAALFAGPSGVGEDWIERKVGDLTVKRSEATGLAAEFRQLGKKLGRMAAAGVTPYAGGLSIDEKSDVEDDTDRVRPAFSRGLFDNPLAVDAAIGSTSST